MRGKRAKEFRRQAEQLVLQNGGTLDAPKYATIRGKERFGILAPNSVRYVYRKLKQAYKQAKGK